MVTNKKTISVLVGIFALCGTFVIQMHIMPFRGKKEFRKVALVDTMQTNWQSFSTEERIDVSEIVLRGAPLGTDVQLWMVEANSSVHPIATFVDDNMHSDNKTDRMLRSVNRITLEQGGVYQWSVVENPTSFENMIAHSDAATKCNNTPLTSIYDRIGRNHASLKE